MSRLHLTRTAAVCITLMTAALSSHGKKVICIDADDSAFVNNHEGYERQRGLGPNDVIRMGGNLTDHLAQVANNDELVIIAHGAGEGQGFNWGDTTYIGFGAGANQMPVPPGFGNLRNVTVKFCSCWSARDPDGAGPNRSLTAKILDAMGGADKGHTISGFNNIAVVQAKYRSRGGTEAQRNAAKTCLKEDPSWMRKAPKNRPGAQENQEAAAQALVNACAGAGGAGIVIITVTEYSEPVNTIDDPPAGSGADGCSCAGPPGCGIGLQSSDDVPPGCGPLRIQRAGNTLFIDWTGNCRLQFASAIPATSWTDVTGAVSPYALVAIGNQRFFRTISADGQSCSPNVVGYVNAHFVAGRQIVANPLNQTNNFLSTILLLPDTAEGTTVILDRGVQEQFVWVAGTWMPNDPVVNPGEGFFIEPPVPVDMIWTGEVSQGLLANPLPAGLSLRSSIVPQSGLISTDLGLPIEDFDTVSLLNPSTQTFTTHTYFFGSWDPVEPVIPVGTGFYVNRSSGSALWIRNFSVGDCRSLRPPIITRQPQSLTVPAGQQAVFCVIVQGLRPFTYQWFRNGALIPGATSDTLILPNVTLADHGAVFAVQVSNADGAVTSAPATLTVGPALVLPVIHSLSSTSGVAGEIITINGTNFGTVPDDVCVVLVANNRVIGCEVTYLQDTVIKVRLPYIPLFASGVPHQLKIGRGVGIRGCPVPAYNDVQVIDLPWVWHGRTEFMVMAPVLFFPIHTVPPRAAFHSGPPNGGVLTLTLDGDWGAGVVVNLTARVLRSGAAGDINFSGVKFLAAGSRLDCANRICDLLIQTFAEQGFVVNCTAALFEGNAVITLSLPGGEPIVAGTIDVIVLPPAPVIHTVSPSLGGPGDIVTLMGTNFGTVPDDLCVVLQHASGVVWGCEVLYLEDTVLKVRLPWVPVWAAGQVKLKIVRGVGVRGCPVPAPGLVLVANPWVWIGRVEFMAMIDFTVIFRQPPRAVFHSGPPVDGALQLVIDGDWGAGRVINLSARILRAGANGVDINFSGLKFTAAGTRLECAQKICELLAQTFAARGLIISCTAALVGNNAVITIRLASGEAIVMGTIDLEVLAPGPVITSLSQVTGGAGEIIVINGLNFGAIPDDLCVVLQHPSGRVFGCEVLFVQNNVIKIRLPFIPAWAIGAVKLKVVRGFGVRGCPVPGPGLELLGNPWVWAGHAEFMAMIDFTVIFANPPPGIFHSGPPTDGVLRLTIDGDWGAGTAVTLTARILRAGAGGVDVNFSGLRFNAAGDRLQCAQRICDLLVQTFEARGLTILCNVALEGANAVITIRLPSGEAIVMGAIDLEVLAAPPIIISLSATTGGPGELITIHGANFGTVVDDLCVVLEHNGRVLGCQVIFVQDTSIVVRLPRIPIWAGGVAHQLKVGRGRGVRGCVFPMFGDIVNACMPWAWVGHPAFMAMATVTFTPIYVAAPQPVFHSGPPTNNTLTLVLDADWGAGVVVHLTARILRANAEGVDVNFDGVKFLSAGSRLQCAERICDLLRQQFAGRGQPIVCMAAMIGTNAVITVSLPGGAAMSAGAIDLVVEEAIIRLAIIPFRPHVAIIWNWGCALQCSTNATGPWHDVPNAASPFVIPVADLTRYYRVRE